MIPDTELDALRERNLDRHRVLRWARSTLWRFRAAQFRNLDVDDHNRQAIFDAKSYAKLLVGQDFRNCPNLVLTGPVGSGKTWLAWAVLFHVLELLCQRPRATTERIGYPPDEFRGNFFALAILEATVRDTFGKGAPGGGILRRLLPQAEDEQLDRSSGLAATEDSCIRYLTALDLLLLDELALGTPTEFTTRLLYGVVNGRYVHGRPTIYTANISLGKAIERNLIDGRVVSRMMDGAVHIHLSGPDRRIHPAPSAMSRGPRLNLGFELDPDPERITELDRRSFSECCDCDDSGACCEAVEKTNQQTVNSLVEVRRMVNTLASKRTADGVR